MRVLALGVAAGLLATGYSSPRAGSGAERGSAGSEGAARGFAVPEALCGVAVPRDALSRLLPASGEELTVDDEGRLSDGSALCKVNVDGHEMVLTLSSERIDAGDSARDILRSRLRVTDPKTAENGRIANSRVGALSLLHCQDSNGTPEDISTLVEVQEPGRQDEGALRELVAGYAGELEEKGECVARVG
ncbi:hypothetical protein AB0O01_23060 [Streptomyces sp. NPDC093252]|uniref:hypothetical protein n=1 Tax=Streptomyces sp. NPDC093252 TaxID=3154980 RepID=UPI003435600C